MEIVIDFNDVPAVRLGEPENFRSFKVVIRGRPTVEQLSAVLTPYGNLADRGHAMITPAGLSALAGPFGEDPEWQASLQKMVDYASSKGWVDPSSGAIHAHCEWEN